MKGTFFNKPLEWNIETSSESWNQGASVSGTLRIKNHSQEEIPLTKAGVALAFAEIKKVHARADGAMKIQDMCSFENKSIKPAEVLQLNFNFSLDANCPVTDKKSSLYLTYGMDFAESNLQLKVEPRVLYAKLVNLLDTFQRFKLKEYKTAKSGVEYKLIPPSSREMANVESMNLIFSMDEDRLILDFDFQVKKLDTASVMTKINKETIRLKKELAPKEYSLGKDMINQDQLLKVFENVLSEVKLKSVF